MNQFLFAGIGLLAVVGLLGVGCDENNCWLETIEVGEDGCSEGAVEAGQVGINSPCQGGEFECCLGLICESRSLTCQINPQCIPVGSKGCKSHRDCCSDGECLDDTCVVSQEEVCE